MSKIQQLIDNYEKKVNSPWEENLSGQEKVWFVVYQKGKERLLRSRISEFELRTKEADKSWFHVDLTDTFPEWMMEQEYREEYFKNPESLDFALTKYKRFVVEKIRNQLTQEAVDSNSVVAVSGVATLFGFLKVHNLVKEVRGDITGRLVVFFPGTFDGNSYRLLDARDGWDYRAVPITNEKGVLS